MDRYREADLVKGEDNSMNKFFGVVLTLLILISIVTLCGCVALYIIKEHEVEKRIFAEKQLIDTTIEKDEITEELEEIKTAKAKIELELALKTKELQGYREQVSMVSVERGVLEDEKSNLAEKSAVVQQSYLSLQKDFEQLQQAKEILEAKLKDVMGSSVRLKTIIVEPEEGFEAPMKEAVKETTEGEVLAVNREYEFLVISIGLNSGLSGDSDVSVYRDSELIAVAKIEKLYEHIAAVVVENKKQLMRVKPGDTIVATIERPFEE